MIAQCTLCVLCLFSALRHYFRTVQSSSIYILCRRQTLFLCVHFCLFFPLLVSFPLPQRSFPGLGLFLPFSLISYSFSPLKSHYNIFKSYFKNVVVSVRLCKDFKITMFIECGFLQLTGLFSHDFKISLITFAIVSLVMYQFRAKTTTRHYYK